MVALVTGTMATRLRNEAGKAIDREKRTLSLYALGREIAAQTDLEQILRTFVSTIAEVVQGQAIILMPGAGDGALVEIASEPPGLSMPDDKERAVAGGSSIGVSLREKTRRRSKIRSLHFSPSLRKNRCLRFLRSISSLAGF